MMNSLKLRAKRRPTAGSVALRFAATTLVLLSAAVRQSAAQELEIAPATELGLSPQRLARVTRMLEAEVRDGNIAGAVALIARHGRIGYFEAVGDRDAEHGSQMQRDSIFRIASMTKAVTSVAVMMLVEEGRVSLDDPVSKHLPDFVDFRVLASIDGEDMTTVAARRTPTLRDLLTHTSGLTYGWFGPEKLDAVYRRLEIPDLFVPNAETMAERVKRIAKAPLKFQPGDSWDYGVSTDVLGRVVETASGLTLRQFFNERIFRPLGMRDTHFFLPAEKAPRLASLYTIDEGQSLKPVGSAPIRAGFLKFSADYCLGEDGRFYSGGGGLVSTAADYARLLQMLLNGGELEGVRILRRDTVAQMTTNQIGSMQIPFSGHGDGFGFGFGVLTDRGVADDVASVGTFSWGGIFNTYYWVDPQEQLVGVLMTQLFPYDHLEVREKFKRLAYDSIDDSGFYRSYWYQKGIERGNPYFNDRQLRVNAPPASIHPNFASRSEPRSSGLARIPIEEDLRHVRRVNLYQEVWGGHPGTRRKRVSINGRATFEFPEVGAASGHCTHQYPTFSLRPMDLVNGYNALQYACDQGDASWGHYIVDNAALQIGVLRDDARLQEAGLNQFDAKVVATPRQDGEGFTLRLQATDDQLAAVARVHFQGKYFGYDENGDARRTDWHGMTKAKKPYGMLGTATESPFEVTWSTSMLPVQQRVAVRAIIEFNDALETRFLTQPLKNLAVERTSKEQVDFYSAENLPRPFWSRAGRQRQCVIELDVDPSDVVAAELHVVAWTGGAGDVQQYFTLNGQPFPVAEGDAHELVYSVLPVDPKLLQRGGNYVRLVSDTEHHGIEVMRPGPALVIRRRGPQSVRLIESASDQSAAGLDCYKIETPNAVYYLDKVGAGLSSLIDRDGNDWIGFDPRPGSGAAGEYRGFPNAVFREQGSYFHPMNEGTDPCVTVVETVQPDRVVIAALSGNGLWAGRYEFTADACTFTMTKAPPGGKYWALYEGTPGGRYDDDDWWMTSEEAKKFPLTATHEGDIAAPEWIAFGDASLPRALFLAHLEDDQAPDRFYQMERKMTVFGFGRRHMEKHLKSAPRSFAIGLVESTNHADVAERVGTVASQVRQRRDQTAEAIDATPDSVARRTALERFALTAQGDASAGAKLFANDERTKCAVCHRVGTQGGDVGPDLSKIGGKFDRPHLIESLLEPSRQIVEGYRSVVVITNEGRVHTGVVKSSDEQSITVVDAENRATQINRDEIDEVVDADVSIMPEGLADALSPQEFADLMAYLETLRTGNPKFGSGVRGPIEVAEGFEIATTTTGLDGATALEIAPDGRILICEQGGSLRVVKNGKLLAEPMLRVPVESYWERGLIGVTVSPKFPTDPYVYVVYVSGDPYPHHLVSRFRVQGDVAVPDSEEVLLVGDDQRQLGGNVPAGHQGGGIHFGVDGKLFIGIGEQTAGLPAQELDTLQGKILRINPNGSIPSDNPFLSQTDGKYQAIWAIGCRNPFTFAVQRSTGLMLINDVGGKFEEINPGVAGANYGWPVIEHGFTEQAGYVGPIHVYPEASIAGGDFADEQLPGWPSSYQGKYFFADFVHGWIKTLEPDAPADVETFAAGIRRPVDLRFSPDGSLYVLLRNAWVMDDKFEGGTGSLLRIRPISP